jgi:hypothetical protein
MKRTIFVLMCLHLIFIWNLGSETVKKERKFMVQIYGQVFFPSDENFQDVYGSSVFLPGLKVGYRILDKIYIWLGYDYLFQKGTTPVLEEEAESCQHFISLGGGYQGRISSAVGYKAELGLCAVSYTEASMGEEVSDTAIGVLFDSGIIFKLGEKFFGMVQAGYGYASDRIEGVRIKLGGFRTGAGFVICF